MSRKSRAEADAAMMAADGNAPAIEPAPPRRGRPPKPAAAIGAVPPAAAAELQRIAGELHGCAPYADAVIPAAPEPAEALATPAPAAEPAATFAPPLAADLPLDQLCPSPLNPRRAIDAADLRPLADSIAANGILQPLLVRPASAAANEAWTTAGHIVASYEIICGARRDAAAWLAQSEGMLAPGFTVPVRIRECDDAELVILAATENLARADMHALDEAAVFAAMRPHVKPRDGQTTEAAIGKALGVSERTVFRRLALTKLAPELATALRDKQITLAQGQAFALGTHNEQRHHLKEMRQHSHFAGVDRIRATNRAALAVACLGYLGEDRMHGMQIEAWKERHQPQSATAERDAIDFLLKTAALGLPEGSPRPVKSPRPNFSHGYRGDDSDPLPEAGAWLAALLSLDAKALIRQFDNAVLCGRDGEIDTLASGMRELVDEMCTIRNEPDSLAMALYATPDMPMLWGQPGARRVNWQHEGETIPLRLTTDGLFGVGDDWYAFQVHAVDPDKPFLVADAAWQAVDFVAVVPVAIDFASWAVKELEAELLTGRGGETLPAPRPLVPLNPDIRAALAPALATAAE